MCEPAMVSDIARNLSFSIAAIVEAGGAPPGSYQRDLARRAERDIQADIKLIQAFIAAREDMTVAAAMALVKR